MKCTKCHSEIHGPVIYIHTLVVDARLCPNCFVTRHENPQAS